MHNTIEEFIQTMRSAGFGWVADLIRDEIAALVEVDAEDAEGAVISTPNTRRQLAAVERVVRLVFLDAYANWVKHAEVMERLMPDGIEFVIGDVEVGDDAGIPLFEKEYQNFYSSIRRILADDNVASNTWMGSKQ